MYACVWFLHLIFMMFGWMDAAHSHIIFIWFLAKFIDFFLRKHLQNLTVESQYVFMCSVYILVCVCVYFICGCCFNHKLANFWVMCNANALNCRYLLLLMMIMMMHTLNQTAEKNKTFICFHRNWRNCTEIASWGHMCMCASALACSQWRPNLLIQTHTLFLSTRFLASVPANTYTTYLLNIHCCSCCCCWYWCYNCCD